MKRSHSDANGAPVSPPISKKKIESNVTGKAVANFFKKRSEKDPEKLRWKILHDSLVMGKYDPISNGANLIKDDARAAKRRKIAAFDFDSTLIKTSSGNAFGRSAEDWQWWDSVVPKKLRELYDNGFQLVIISNQAGISLKGGSKKGDLKSGVDSKRVTDFKTKVGYVLTQLELPMTVFAATEKNEFRKPRTGMWTQMLHEYGLQGSNEEGIDLEASLFVGDAGGRPDGPGGVKGDHSCSDRDFAANVGIAFHTPEEFFLNEPPRPFQRSIDPLALVEAQLLTTESSDATEKVLFTKSEHLEIVLLCGSPGAGKSTFYEKAMKPLGYERVNQDILKTRDKCLKKAAEYLDMQHSIAVDNTNADVDTRRYWIELAKKYSIPIRVVYLSTSPGICRHNDAVRAAHESSTLTQQTNSNAPSSLSADVENIPEDLTTSFNPERRTLLPTMAFTSFQSRFIEPRVEEGFSEIIKIPFEFRGSNAARSVWGKYWI